jgi:hypothetical protein
VGPRAKQQKKKKVGARSLIRSTLEVGGVLDLQDRTRKKSQARVQDDINLHNQEKKAISASRMEVLWQT